MLRLGRVTPVTVDVLRALLAADLPTWGLRLVGETDRPAGSVYPILARLEAGRWVSSSWDESDRRGARRRLYALTDDGRTSAAAVVAAAPRPAAERPAAGRPAAEPGLA
ncbi:helix-turn-helix transcriptional regulator [Amnibacterium kyonggiense]